MKEEVKKALLDDVATEIIEKEVKKAAAQLKPMIIKEVARCLKSKAIERIIKKEIRESLIGYDYFDFVPETKFNKLMTKAVTKQLGL